MKRIFLSFAAVLMAVTLSAEKVIDIDLAKYQTIDDNATAVLTDNELTVSYNLGAWGASGVSFALDNLTNVQNISFEFKGDAAATTWTSFFACLVDANGKRFHSAAADLSIHGEEVNLAFREIKYMPTDELWGNNSTPTEPYTGLVFLANPQNPTAATFAIRNVKVYVNDTETALQTPATSGGVAKIVENGQVYILRDGVCYNALGAVVE